MSTLALARRWSVAAAGSNSIASMVATVARRAERRLKIWQDQRRLAALPDHLLIDIGVSRGEFRSVTEFGRLRALGPSYRL